MLICPFSEAGCDWEGKFIDYKKHVNGCAFAMSSCEYCKKKIHKSQLESHQHSCPNKPKACPLAAFGCKTTTMSKEELQQHMEESHSEHLNKLVVGITSIEKKVTLECSKNCEMHVSRSVPAMVTADSAMSSSKVSQSMHQQQSKAHFVACLQDIESDGCSMGVDAVSGRKMEMLIREEIQSLQEEIRNSLAGQLRSREEEISSLKMSVTKMEKTMRLKNAESEDRDFRLSLIENGNYDGSVIWKIPQFSQRKADAVNGKYTSIFSLPFYSGRYGYKMCLRLYIMGDGIGKGTHLSLFFVVMRGEFDNILQWPFTHKVTFKLINQSGGRDIVDTFQPDPMSSSFRKPKSDMNIASGCPRFVSHTELERGGFIVDDTIFIKCMIDTSTIRHP